jgi:acyl dehydratase
MSAAPTIDGLTDLAPPDWPTVGQTIDRRDFGPFTAEQLARYASASGDDNPLHLDPAVATAAGLEMPPVHGMLMMSCFEPTLGQWRRDVAIYRLAGKFLRPVLVGQSIAISGRVVRASRAPRAELFVRLMAHGPNGALAILAEATLRHANGAF